MFSCTVIHGKTESSWNTIAVCGLAPSVRAMVNLPEVWRSSPAMIRTSVVLPHPDGPNSTKNSPSRTVRSTDERAVTGPYPVEKTFVKPLRTILSTATQGYSLSSSERRLVPLANPAVHLTLRDPLWPQDPRNDLTSRRLWLGAPPRFAAPSAPDRPAGLPLPICGLSVAALEFTACDQVANCAAALEGSPLPPREMTRPFRGDPDIARRQQGHIAPETIRDGAGGGAAERLEASRGRR